VDKEKLIELAAAIRMTCANPDLIRKAVHMPLIVAFDDSPEALKFSRGRGCLQETAEKLNLRPVAVFSRKTTAQQMAETLAESIRTTRAIPNIVAIEGAGLFTVGRTRREALRYRSCLLEGFQYTVGTEQEELMHKRLPGHVVVVTGSAQGFGKGIAEELAAQGAHVVIADLNDDAGAQTCAEINKRYGEETAVYCHADVTDGESLSGLVADAFRAFGGIDIFVANAGVLKAGGVHEMEPSAFEFVTKVNYTAFFLCVKAVAPALKVQHVFNPHAVADIVQVNSKSGLQGSNRNFAYAGSKFGSIGLVQSFAMELIEHNIKVNAICPGNYFEGPLGSDPKKGLFVQYLKTGKVPGAKTITDVKRFYMDKVPMRRGCLPLDVAKAILYAHDQEYETGQAIPVTGGQVMLN
jgi:NAD(P)-dependent dehydrogenase (short-subunit alcohol dehydrogenase family)